jgi:hypothetical protein
MNAAPFLMAIIPPATPAMLKTYLPDTLLGGQ